MMLAGMVMQGLCSNSNAQIPATTYAECAVSFADALLAELDRTATANQSLTVPPDLDAMISACIPGGNACDPQEVADSIRQWFADHIGDANKKAPDDDGWIPHTLGDPMPCDGDLRVHVQLRWEPRFAAQIGLDRASKWHWGQLSNRDNEIIAWKPAE